MTDRQLTMIEEDYLTAPFFAVDMAAAKLTMHADIRMAEALRRSGLTLEQVAERISPNTTVERIEEIIASEGNVNFATFARFMRACGYVVEFKVFSEVITDEGRPVKTAIPDTPPRPSRRNQNKE